MRRAAHIPALAATLALAACAAIAPPPPAAHAPFDIVGRVAVNSEGRAFSSNVRWQHAGGRGELWLLSPLGQTIAHIESDANGATLTASDKRQYRAESVEALTRQALGWELPLSRLTWWVRGEPVPGTPATKMDRDERSRLVSLVQDGWQIAYTHYPPGEQGGLPRRLDLKSGAQDIRLLIDTWRDLDPAR